MVTVAALTPDSITRARLLTALRGQAQVIWCSSGVDLLSTVKSARVAIALLEVRDELGPNQLEIFRQLRNNHPSVALIACVDLTHRGVHNAIAMVREGVHAVLIRGFDDDWAGMRQIISEAAAVSAASQITSRIAPLLPENLRPFFQFCASRADRAITVSLAADALRTHRRTLLEWCVNAGLPAPSQVIGWHRVLHVSWRASDPGVTAGHLASILDFPSASAMLGQLRRYTGLSWSALRARGGFSVTLAQFELSLTRFRGRLTRPKLGGGGGT